MTFAHHKLHHLLMVQSTPCPYAHVVIWSATVQGTHCHCLCRSWNFVPLAEWLKSRRESDENMLILRFSIFIIEMMLIELILNTECLFNSLQARIVKSLYILYNSTRDRILRVDYWLLHSSDYFHEDKIERYIVVSLWTR